MFGRTPRRGALTAQLAAILGNVVPARHKVAGGLPPCSSWSRSSAPRCAREWVQQILAFSRRQPQRLVNQALAP